MKMRTATRQTRSIACSWTAKAANSGASATPVHASSHPTPLTSAPTPSGHELDGALTRAEQQYRLAAIGILHDTEPRPVIQRPASPQLERMPYLQPKPSPTALVPFPAKIAPPALVCASVTSTSTAQPDRDVAQVRDANSASNPLKVPRIRSRGQSASATVTLLKTYEAKAAQVTAAAPSASDSSSCSATGRPKRARGQRRPVLSIQQPASVVTEPAHAPAPSPPASAPAPAVKHEPVNAPGGGLRINLEAIKRTYSESQVTPPVISHAPRLSVPTLPSLIRKKSGEVLKSSLKPFSPSGPNGAPVHLPSPSKSRGMRIDTEFSPITSPRVRQPCKSAPATPTAPKAVHFDHQLEHVKFFLSEQKPAAVSRDGSPTEDSDTSGTERGRKGLHSFAMMPQSPSSEDDKFRASLGLRIVNAAPVVRDTLPVNVDVQAQSFILTPDKRDVHVGILVRNVAFNKAVAVRFTLDNWQTTSEVGARHVESVWSNPAKRGSADPDMDRFACTVRLGDFGGRIKQKTMLAAVRYEIPGTNRSFWDNNNGANYQIVFEPQAECEPPSPVAAAGRTEWGAPNQLGDLRRELEKVVRNEDRLVQQNTASARYDWGRGGRWQPRPSASVPPANAVPFPSRGARPGPGAHRQWQSENTPPRPTFKMMADSRGSPRDTDEADFARFAARRGGADSDSELEPRGPKLRKKPGSYFDIPVLPAHLSWGYALDRRSPTKEKKSAPVFEIGAPGSASSSEDSSGTAREAPTVIVSDSDNDSDTERSTTPVPHVAAGGTLESAPQLLEDRSRTSSSSSVSSTGSWDLPPSPLESATATTAFATAVFGADLTLSPLSMASTPAVSTTTSTSSSSPLESPGSPADEYMPQRSPFVNLDAFFAANASGARPPVDSSNYSYFLDRFCFYTGKDGEPRDIISPTSQTARGVPPAAVVDDYFGTSVSGSPPMLFTSKFVESAGPIHPGPLHSPQDLMPAIHATLASANSAETDTTTTTLTVSGHSTPTTPRAGTPTPIGAIVPLSAMFTPTPA